MFQQPIFMNRHNVQADEVKSIVVRAPNWVGDVVMSVPAIRRLKQVFPSARMTVVTRSGSAGIFAEADFVDDVLIHDDSSMQAAAAQVREWRRRRFDLAVLLQNAFQSAAIAFLARIPLRAGYQTDRRGVLLTRAVPLPAWKNDRHEIYYYLNLVREVERLFDFPKDNTAPDFTLPVSEDRRRTAFEILGREGVRAGEPIVLLCPGSINSRAKRWPAEYYGALSDLFIEHGTQVALIGSAAELDVCRAVLAAAHHPLVVLTGKTSVAEVASIIAVADILITNDTGPAHIASAVRTPALVIFGPTNPATTRPFGPESQILRRPPECAPCMLRDCPIDHRCMTVIEPAEVFASAQRLLMRERAEVIA